MARSEARFGAFPTLGPRVLQYRGDVDVLITGVVDAPEGTFFAKPVRASDMLRRLTPPDVPLDARDILRNYAPADVQYRIEEFLRGEWVDVEGFPFRADAAAERGLYVLGKQLSLHGLARVAHLSQLYVPRRQVVSNRPSKPGFVALPDDLRLTFDADKVVPEVLPGVHPGNVMPNMVLDVAPGAGPGSPYPPAQV